MDVTEIIHRIEALNGADNGADIALLQLWEPSHDALRTYDERYETDVRDGVFSVWKRDGGYSASVPFPRFTNSVDAALSLAERLLPQYQFAIYTNGGGYGPTCLAMMGDEPVKANVKASTLPLAIIIAALRASGVENDLQDA